ncbi:MULTISPECIES: iron ABC transporter permease [Exiguobacterium]|jgi:iron(III) transport system permease protein|uniref:ABC transporter permease n=1 Tax=Exiguobacterium TaxID=33986 RepID=UPI000736834B|nr:MULTISPECIES: iron ABC transporter permease [Exiguobacterium]MCT4776257.1 iron ABC transporter permease [Exiguobacterium aquaticum]MCT4788544.1 iron ABC transporter permease [Exiguobacterium mexicanum]TCI70679.1 iron ABC transporter permease [Exiguobacterium sp. IPCI3]TCI79559.1 iron ABC transporter permease [Exiguobacterium sp. IPCH1]TCI82352.1 iron ABC transporter permease [Exiguobacterium sp. IPBC4]
MNWYALKRQLNGWAILSFIALVFIVLPGVVVLVELFAPVNDNWQHIREYLLPTYVRNTLFIMLATGLLTTIIGTSLAWFVTVYDFPFRRFFKWALILPLAIPPYIGGYTYHGILNYTGVIQTTLRNEFGITVDQTYFNIMTIQGTVFIFTLFLYPYIYTITRAFLHNQSSSMIENARILGRGSWDIFFTVVIPISRVAIIGGVSLVLMEVLNDYGVVKYFGIQTFSTAIFSTWFGMKDTSSALKLAGTLMILVIAILTMERLVRGRKQFSYATTKVKPLKPRQLTGWHRYAVFGYVATIFAVAFLIPFVQLVAWTVLTFEQVFTAEFFRLVWNTVSVAFIATVIILVFALIIANYTRLFPSNMTRVISKVTTLGYSIPGAAIAIAVITLFLLLDEWVLNVALALDLGQTFVFRTTLIMLIFAYVIRFLAIGYNSIESGFEKVGKSFTEASRMLGWGTVQTFFRVDIPMIKGAIMSAFILVFIDIMKELPLTLFLQPFNFSTLATQAFKYVSDEKIHEAALASIVIVLMSGLLIFVFHKVLDKEAD